MNGPIMFQHNISDFMILNYMLKLEVTIDTQKKSHIKFLHQHWHITLIELKIKTCD